MKPGFAAIPLFLFSSLGFSGSLNYSIVVDAGSTSSRLYIYEVNTLTAVPTIKKVFTADKLKDDKGLASYATKPAEVQNYVKPLFDGAQTYLKNNGIDQKTTPISFLGTAGMRSLADKSIEQKLYQEVQKSIENNNYGFPIQDIKTISGEMEGLYGWMDINYLLGNFQKHNKPVGSIDMGGASTQIVYSTTESQSPNVFSFTIDNIPYSVFSKSFLGLGQNQSLDNMSNYEKSAACFPLNYTYKGSQTGAFDSSTCIKIYTDIIDKKQVKEQIAPYPMDGQSFIAYSGIFYTFNFLGTDKTPNQAALEEKIKNVCYKDWSELKKAYPNENEAYLSAYCAYGVYEDQLLFNTYNLQGSQLTIASKIADQSVEWTLGAVLYGLVK